MILLFRVVVGEEEDDLQTRKEVLRYTLLLVD
jgi:hypothetical protein